MAILMRRGVLPSCTLLVRRIIADWGLFNPITQVEVEKLGIGKDSEVILKAVAIVVLCRHVLRRRVNGVQVCNVLRHIRRSATIKAGHGC